MSEDNTENTHQFVVVLKKGLEPGPALNAAAHLAACLVARADEDARGHMSFLDYTDRDGNVHPVSATPQRPPLRFDRCSRIRGDLPLTGSIFASGCPWSSSVPRTATRSVRRGLPPPRRVPCSSTSPSP